MSPARVSLDPSQRSADSIELTEGLKNLVIGQDEACEKLARRIVGPGLFLATQQKILAHAREDQPKTALPIPVRKIAVKMSGEACFLTKHYSLCIAHRCFCRFFTRHSISDL